MLGLAGALFGLTPEKDAEEATATAALRPRLVDALLYADLVGGAA
jgi:hypothetical protein